MNATETKCRRRKICGFYNAFGYCIKSIGETCGSYNEEVKGMKISEEKTKTAQIQKAIQGCIQTAVNVVNPHKKVYLEELEEAAIHMNKAVQALNKF